MTAASLGQMMVGARSRKRERREHDFYPTTEWEPTAALVEAEASALDGLRIWEPACGAGDMARELLARGVRLDWSTDLVDRGFGEGGVDFLAAPAPEGCDGIISNPPFNIADRFIERAIGDHGFTYVALLLKATYWNAGRRIGLHRRFPPTAYLPLGFRVDFTGEGQPPMDLFWFIWDARAAGTVRFQPLPKPARLKAAVADLFGQP
jgi:hypothetical protein